MSASISKEHPISGPGTSPQTRVDGLLDRLSAQIDRYLKDLGKKPVKPGLEHAFEEHDADEHDTDPETPKAPSP